MSDSQQNRPPKAQQPPDVTAQAILDAIASVRYGVVQVVIQDGRIVQIEKTEKIRLTG
jgi:hypothetical protein